MSLLKEVCLVSRTRVFPAPAAHASCQAHSEQFLALSPLLWPFLLLPVVHKSQALRSDRAPCFPPGFYSGCALYVSLRMNYGLSSPLLRTGPGRAQSHCHTAIRMKTGPRRTSTPTLQTGRLTQRAERTNLGLAADRPRVCLWESCYI